MPSPDDKCRTCEGTWAWHEKHKPIHPFNDGSAGATAFLRAGRDRDPQSGGNGAQRGSETPPRVIWPTDPVLRVALINAGVITPEDLRAAEAQLSAVMGDVLTEGAKGGQQATSVRGREVQE